MGASRVKEGQQAIADELIDMPVKLMDDPDLLRDELLIDLKMSSIFLFNIVSVKPLLSEKKNRSIDLFCIAETGFFSSTAGNVFSEDFQKAAIFNICAVFIQKIDDTGEQDFKF